MDEAVLEGLPAVAKLSAAAKLLVEISEAQDRAAWSGENTISLVQVSRCRLINEVNPEVISDEAVLEGHAAAELPTATKLLVELSKSQDPAAWLGGNTTSLVQVAREYLKICRWRLINEVNPEDISDVLHEACADATDTLTAMAVPVDLTGRDSSSYLKWLKVIKRNATLLSPLAAEAIRSLIDSEKPEIVDLSDIKIVKKPLDDTVKGFVFKGGPTRVENAKIAVIQFQIEEEEERSYLLGMIQATGCNTLVIPKTCVFSDDDISILAQANVMVITDLERQGIELVAENSNCLPIANIEQFGPGMLGQALVVEEASLGDGMMLKMTVTKQDMWTSTSLLIHAPTHLALSTIDFFISSKSSVSLV